MALLLKMDVVFSEQVSTESLCIKIISNGYVRKIPVYR